MIGTGHPIPDQHSSRDPFVVMAKPVGPACNLACSYCYYLDSARLYERPHRFRMSDAILERYVRQFIEASPGPLVHFVWHGGEPTLAGLGFYRRAVELQRRYLPDGWKCWNNLQTNGTLLDDAWCAFLAEEGFEVGVSLDGPEVLHDSHRRDSLGRGSHARAMAGLRRLLDHGVEPDLLCTVTAATAAEPLTVYRYLRDLGPSLLQFLPVGAMLICSGPVTEMGPVSGWPPKELAQQSEQVGFDELDDEIHCSRSQQRLHQRYRDLPASELERLQPLRAEVRIERAAINGVLGWVPAVWDRVALGRIAEGTRITGCLKHVVVAEEGPTQELAVRDRTTLPHLVIRVALILQH
jgi:uncharacterized Fe-S cluster-containing radical SAM superfamily protein